jgi:AraC-like DNA-binding protein
MEQSGWAALRGPDQPTKIIVKRDDRFHNHHTVTKSNAPPARHEFGRVVRAEGTNRMPPRRPKPAATRRMAVVFEFIDTRLGSDLSLGELSALVAMSKYHFLRTFKHVSGMTPHQYILGRRLRAAAAALRSTDHPIARVALDQGFGDLSTFNHTFHRVMGVTPTAFRSST